MANIRRGFSDDFVVKNNKVGINTAEPQVTLDVKGTIKATNLKTTGVTTVTAYEGFLNQDQNILESTTIKGGSSLSGEIIVGTGVTVTVDSVGITTALVGNGANYTRSSNNEPEETIEAGGSQIESLKVYNTFNPPAGGTNERPEAPKPGELYYNYDFKTIEFFDGYGWRQVDNTTRSGRGVLMGGRNEPGAEIANISYIQITTKGNATNFGDLNAGARETGGCLGSETRSIKGGGQNAEEQNEIEYITTASQGNAIDFGDLNNRVRSMGAVSSSTRGLFASGCVHPNTDTDVIDYIEIATVGNALDFGDHVAARNVVAIGSPIKACFGNGNSSTTMRTVNFASKGDTVFFGDATQDTSGAGTIGNSTRGIFCGGYLVPLGHGCPAIGSITFASLGNTTDFGEMLTGVGANNGGMSTPTKGVIGPGQETFTGSNTHFPWLDEITISTYGSAVDFGDPGPHSNFTPKVSDSHGGLGGF
tara:strand:- start:4 stop:1434 length:1431 start_codon:yes stop_codon:yes gene_type:complete